MVRLTNPAGPQTSGESRLKTKRQKGAWHMAAWNRSTHTGARQGGTSSTRARAGSSARARAARGSSGRGESGEQQLKKT